MMIIYLAIAFLATLLGAGAGMGGGVIIKPLMDLMGDYSVTQIAVYSSITVFSMALFATGRQVAKGFKVTPTMVLVTIGAVLGGVGGSLVFTALTQSVNPAWVTAVQSAVLILLLSICLFYDQVKPAKVSSRVLIVLIGAALGLFSAFLGIGGGPINVAVLCILLCLQLRIAARASVFIILFSQAAGLFTKWANGTFLLVQDFTVLLYMIPAAIIGGLLGAKLNQSLPTGGIKWVYRISVVLVMLISAYNLINALLQIA